MNEQLHRIFERKTLEYDRLPEFGRMNREIFVVQHGLNEYLGYFGLTNWLASENKTRIDSPYRTLFSSYPSCKLADGKLYAIAPNGQKFAILIEAKSFYSTKNRLSCGDEIVIPLIQAMGYSVLENELGLGIPSFFIILTEDMWCIIPVTDRILSYLNDKTIPWKCAIPSELHGSVETKELRKQLANDIDINLIESRVIEINESFDFKNELEYMYEFICNNRISPKPQEHISEYNFPIALRDFLITVVRNRECLSIDGALGLFRRFLGNELSIEDQTFIDRTKLDG